MLNVRTNSQIADLLTKALNAQQFSFLVSKLNMVNIHAPLPLKGGCQDTKGSNAATKRSIIKSTNKKQSSNQFVQ